jgi:flagellar basal-body rod modification protein FlgD
MATITEALTTTRASGTGTTGPRELGQDDFLRLLVTQLKHQDPLKPIDNAAFVAELAQFSQLEQSAKQVKLLEQGIETQSASLQFSMLPLVGREIRFHGGVVELAQDPVSLQYGLDEPAAAVTVTISDLSNRTVRTLALGPQEAGSHQVDWDSATQSGSPAAPGMYRFTVAALNTQGDRVNSTVTSRLRVSGVRMENGRPMLLVGDQVLDPGQVIEFH